MKVHHLFIVGLTFILASCSNGGSTKEEIYAKFYPRTVFQVSLTPYGSIENKHLVNSMLYLVLKTSDGPIERRESVNYYGDFDISNYNDAVTPLEKEIENSYFNYMEAMYGDKIITRSIIQTIEYRTTGVNNLVITADKSLGGIPAGESLNSLFILNDFNPKIIIDKDTKEILVGWGDTANFPTSLSEWLAHNPLAQASMVLKLSNSVSDEIPETITFSVTLTTDTDQVLKANAEKMYTIY